MDRRRRALLVLSALTLPVLVGYLGSVFLLEESFLGVDVRLRHLVALVLLSLAVGIGLGRLARSPRAVARAINLQLALLTTCALMIAADVAYGLLENARAPVAADPEYARVHDANLLVGEFYPSIYYPTERNFHLHKPGQTATGTSYGVLYASDMLRSPTLLGSTLERRTVSITINDHGFREELPLATAQVVALGDSFTFGWGVDADHTWVKRLAALRKTPIYNLGIHDASPRQELELLKFLLAGDDPPFKPRHVLWMIYEGNDLEDDYEELAPPAPHVSLVDDTLLEPFLRLPYVIKHEAVVTKIRRGTIRWREAAGGSREVVDGVALESPLFESARLGRKLFYRPSLDLVQDPESYVRTHPNRAKLQGVFAEMGDLARRAGFAVTVVLAPTDARLHGRFFEGFPTASAASHFLELVAELARAQGFGVVDLLAGLQPLAGERLLYLRDDDHWNEDGNAAVAAILAKELANLGR
jgi:hypothetical protein